MVAVFYAEKPGSDVLYCYRVYEAGNMPVSAHVEAMKEGEPGMPFRAVGGSPSEQQWRDEFDDAGWPIEAPEFGDFWLGINQVYAAHRQSRIVYFDDLPIVQDKSRYRREKDKQGNVVNKVHNKNAFHRLDAERYIIPDWMAGGINWDSVEGLGQVEDFESRWTIGESNKDKR